MAKWVIIFDRDKCIGCGACEKACPENWQVQEDGKSMPKRMEFDEPLCNKDAQEVCPVNCIKVVEKNKE